MSPDEKVQCFRCHATDAVDHKKLTLSALIPGVQCERCHGSAENHVKSVKLGDAKGAVMNDLRKMTSEQTANFCGQCHRTWDEIAGSGLTGVANVRFQPYRLISSKCYDADDKRIRCTTCHDPHGEVSRTRCFVRCEMPGLPRWRQGESARLQGRKRGLRHVSYAEDRTAGIALQVH